MNTTTLADLDELVLSCRDDKARAYIIEATTCYRGGAFRSAIVATWIAVCYDMIDKLRELALAGDGEAAAQVRVIENARAAGNLEQSLKFERDILVLAQQRFELISPLEYIDLERLREDRNRCAHPTLVSDEQPFLPSAELARLHIRSAVTHLLQHQPVQGKYALERITNEVDSLYFPTDPEKAIVAFLAGPLRNPRESLVRNSLLVFVKTILDATVDWPARRRYLSALKAVSSMHRGVFDAVMKERLSAFVRSSPDNMLTIGLMIITAIDGMWEFLTHDVQIRLQNFVEGLSADQFDRVEIYLAFPPLARAAERRIRLASARDFKDSIFFGLHPILATRIIELYLRSRNYDEANSLAAIITLNAGDFSKDEVRRVVEAILVNGTLYGSATASTTLEALRKTEILSEAEFDTLLERDRWGKFKPSVAATTPAN